MSSDRYTIADLAREFGVTPRALRFYEDQRLIAPRREGQSRQYSATDRARLAWILRGKRVGFSLAEIAEMLDLYDLGEGRKAQRQVTLARCSERIKTLEAQRADIDKTIAELEAFTDLLEDLIAHPEREEAARARFHEAVGDSGVGPPRLDIDTPKPAAQMRKGS